MDLLPYGGRQVIEWKMNGKEPLKRYNYILLEGARKNYWYIFEVAYLY